MNPTIIKCGGSLLSLPDLPARLLALVDAESLKPALVLVGGGAAVDVVREWDQLHDLPEEECHDLAISAMTLNARMLISTHERFRPVTSLNQAVQLSENSVGVLIADEAIRQLETQNPPLPRSWNVTSDSIGAWLATIYDSHLLLLKSVSLPARPLISVVELADAGMVDPHFPRQSSAVKVMNWCNLRAEPATIQPITLNQSST